MTGQRYCDDYAAFYGEEMELAKIEMKTYQAELSGRITRDIIWVDVDAINEEQARAMIAEQKPGHQLRSIIEVQQREGEENGNT